MSHGLSKGSYFGPKHLHFILGVPHHCTWRSQGAMPHKSTDSRFAFHKHLRHPSGNSHRFQGSEPGYFGDYYSAYHGTNVMMHNNAALSLSKYRTINDLWYSAMLCNPTLLHLLWQSPECIPYLLLGPALTFSPTFLPLTLPFQMMTLIK